MMIRGLLATTGLALSLGAVHAADAPLVYQPPVVTQEEIAAKFDIAFGAALTSRYISRGVAQSDGAAVQGYVEASYDWVYLGVWASTVDLGDDDVEIDFYGGIRPTFGDLALDIGYARYVYDASGDCCGELYAKASYAFTPQFSAGIDTYWDPEASTNYVAANATVALPYDFSLSGAVGHDFDGKTDWNAGISYTWAETITFDARYHDANTQPSRFVATISVDSSLSALKAISR